MAKSKKINLLSEDEKYRLYEGSVQNVDSDIAFINKEYYKLYKKYPKGLREDFCGTGLLSCAWVKQGTEHKAWGIDLDPSPIDYGKKNHYTKLKKDQAQRVSYIQGNVLDKFKTGHQVVVAFNFSYFLFKKRSELLKYFTAVRKSLPEDGAFFIDIFGGTEAFQELEEETTHDKHSYIWDCSQFNPLTYETKYYIHFKVGKTKYEKVFTYDWRMWTVPELKEILQDAGFSQVLSYWEGDDNEGGGNGVFFATDKAENCQSWVTYLVAKL
jgi:hypothetical protein